jgi:hypothetical protein
MKRPYILLIAILSISACIPSGPAMTLLVNPTTGERITCRAVVLVDQFRRENYVQEYEGLGFVQAQNLTAIIVGGGQWLLSRRTSATPIFSEAKRLQLAERLARQLNSGRKLLPVNPWRLIAVRIRIRPGVGAVRAPISPIRIPDAVGTVFAAVLPVGVIHAVRIIGIPI